MDFITENLKIIILALIALFAGIAITIRINKKKNSNNDNSNKVTQKDNIAKGDIVGRDKNTKTK